MFKYKYSQLENKGVNYNEVTKMIGEKDNEIMHLGQFKLFFSELMYLAKYGKEGYKVLYVGAAPGYHIAKLADLFPTMNFDLWDPRIFDIPNRNNIKIFNHFFTNKTAKIYQKEGDNILFICDIRSLEIGIHTKKKDIEKVDEIVINDMNMQMSWIQIINPINAYLKFRLPYGVQYFKYLDGTIYLQPYAPLSTEARLLTNNYNKYVIYDCYEFDAKMAYFNFFVRYSNTEYKRWEKEMKKYHLKMNWDNAYAFHITNYYLRKIKKIDSDEETGKLFMDILSYHIDKYGKKYDTVFVKTSTENTN